MDSMQSKPLLKWSGHSNGHARRCRRKHINLKSVLLIASCLTSLTFIITWLSTFNTSTLSNWAKNSRKLVQLASDRLSTPFRSSITYKLRTEAEIKERVGNRKFLVRDWPPYLGWNNVRYTIETGLMIANLLDRELVLPGFTYATACEYADQVCAKLTAMFTHKVPVDLASVTDRSRYPDPEEGENFLSPILPTHQWKGWVLPLEVMLDIPHLGSHWKSSISLKDYLELTAPSTYPNYYPSLYGKASGKWATAHNHGLSYYKAPNAQFANMSQTMLDRLPAAIEPLVPENSNTPPPSVPLQLYEKCLATLKKVETLQPRLRQKRDNQLPASTSWNDDLITGDQMTGELALKDHELLERCIASRGYRTAYGYTLDGWWMKAPAGPTKYFRKVENLRGWWDDLHSHNETILHIEGELHNGYPPASMLWTTLEGRQNYEKLVRSAIKPPEMYERIATKLEKRMRAKCGGRSWRAAHMRRGDFVQVEWTIRNITTHFTRLMAAADDSISLLESNPNLLMPAHTAYDTSLELPKLGDPIYLATNVRDKGELEYLRTQKIVLLNDLLDEADKAELGFSSMFMDTLSILEQSLIMRSASFYGDAHSSVNGWILNRRTFHGIDERLTKTEYLKFPGDGR
ncbi:hypothetical protein CROQUDRAFT_721453 [Cronartium quercuum f. sp. fusiforme G11]|uniref:O-fucosyltransferase family protein n=1 Tax=Cronartium quercuum f. sp. fusiforme G11 TaxID=708437 RepID=A0A9P6NR40_9BASI|nr:hypothetical protein CROQUDRAFT_721453 [Cronartium quercuum f. sp. fusiforme G11]